MMETRLDILNELKELSPVIAGIEKVNVFTVPEGYFENLHNDILTGIESEKSLVINAFSNASSTDVPQGYFDTLADTILNKIKMQHAENAFDELRTLSPMLYSIQNENVFAVPQGYFDSLPGAVLNKIKMQNAVSASDELRTLSPMLYSIQNENIFTVPQGYFDSLSDTILDRVKPEQTKVVSMRRRSSTFMKYAVAAAFTGVMALGVFKLADDKRVSVDPVLANSIVGIGTEIARENKFDEELAKINDADIVKYLEASGNDVNAALVANSVDENELPNQVDYLMDEKALDNYLDNINVKGLSN